MASLDYSALGFKAVIVDFDGGVLTVTINRAKQRNSFGGTLPAELIQVFETADRDDRVRVVILTAEHTAPAYSTGADMSTAIADLTGPEGEAVYRDPGGQVAIAIYNCRKYTIAAVNGNAIGVGMTCLQLPFNFRFVWEGAKLAFPFVRLGISPESTSTFLLPRLLGHSRADSLLLAGATVSPTSPLISSLYHEIIPKREDVLPVTLAFARDLATNTSQIAVGYTKGLLQHPGYTIEENHLLDSRTIKILGAREDAAEGALAFKERRKPRFSGALSKISSLWYPWKLTLLSQRKRKALDVKPFGTGKL
ncbi:peroxisomal enoyl-CoA-hydratase [Rhodocollybia butyracea]|uniref:Peroxisomal enoyl-CoA-hydratase n=1 Tax=Rhodocollybia butyracea TaxID=206335 RepID=A0A9P5Q7B2_9AGAR|nr:peroxisomal enoyl-CoA-hydratase [Rhodocollybia butyracea]